MSANDSWWLSFWEWFATIGFVLVIVGCIIEGVEHFVKFKRTESQKRKGIEKLGWLILVGGLAMEFLGDKQAKRISDRENRRLTVEAATARRDAANANALSGEANERAGIANKLAGEANERAATNEVARARLEKEIEMLHKENLELLAKMAPRHLSPEQKQFLIPKLSQVRKASVHLGCQIGDAEANDFMGELAGVFKASGFENVSMAVLPGTFPSGLSFACSTSNIADVPENVRQTGNIIVGARIDGHLSILPCEKDTITIYVGRKP